MVISSYMAVNGYLAARGYAAASGCVAVSGYVAGNGHVAGNGYIAHKPRDLKTYKPISIPYIPKGGRGGFSRRLPPRWLL